MAARRLLNPVTLLWFAAALCGPTSGGAAARAGCDDHARPAISIEGVSGIAGLGAASRPDDAPRPCTGPSCSRPPAAPTTAHAPDRRPPDPGLDTVRTIPPRVPAWQPFFACPGAEYAAPSAEPLDRPPRP